MSEKKNKGRWDAVAIYDGQEWRLLSGADLRENMVPIAGGVGKLPQTLVDQATASQSRSVRFLVSGDVHRIEGAIPSGASLAKANAEMRAAIAEATGVEDDGALVAGFTLIWPGVRKPFTLAAKFDADAAEDFHATLAEAGMRCAGFASLELALLAAWRDCVNGRGTVLGDSSGRAGARPSRDASLLIVGHGHGFLVPAQRGANPGPQTVPCGMRHHAMDAANWLARFQRAAATVAKEAPLHVIALSEHGSEIKSSSIGTTLREAGYANVIEENSDEWLRGAARAALMSRPNRLKGAAIPVANPWELKRRFSNFWLVLVATAILALPYLFRMFCEMQTRDECAALASRQAKYRPLEEKIKNAQKSLAAAKAQLADEDAAQKALVGMRRPLVSFIDVAYFFCKWSGESLVLEAIEQNGMQIEVRGTYSDPEDGVRLNDGMIEYAKEKNMEIVKNESTHEDGGESAFVNRFKIVVDCSKVGEARK